uniref:CSON012730 protein n=1 Tax=Culicoides sonorensis TaxID=179676 RepID=A0A336M6X6_CULSO
MENDILDMEQVLEMDDSFCVNDSDVLKILKTWRLTTGNEGAGSQQSTSVQQQLLSTQKFIDSRTFTRPKKKLMQYPDYTFPSSSSSSNAQQQQYDPSPNRAGLNLQIGGALSNPLNNSMMQRSLITDVSPPNSLASSLSYNECGNSLITSGDFSNIGCLLNVSQIDDENIFHNNHMNMNGFGLSYGQRHMPLNSVSENSTSKFSTNTLLDECKDNNILKTDMHGIEEQASGNSTLQNSMELISSDSDLRAKNDTFTKDETFKQDQVNSTFNATSSGPVLNETFNQIVDDPKNNSTFVKNGTRSIEVSPDKSSAINSTVIINQEQESGFESPVMNKTIPAQLPIQSTPATSGAHFYSKMQKFGKTIVVEDLSPITTQPTTLRRNKKLTVEQDDDNKRISLQNFEDVEKSISLLENTQDEEGFDVILEDITDLKRSLDQNEKFKQSLQNIKNRHSQANLERQQEELFRKKLDATMTIDNKLMESMNKSMSSSGGSERLLNRRSRLDDAIVVPSPQKDVSSENSENKSEKSALAVEGGNEISSGRGNPERKSNRDRFKTMRITKKHIEGMIVIDGEEKEREEYQEEQEEIKDPNVEVINGSYVHLIDKDDDDDDEPLFKKPQIPQKPTTNPGVPQSNGVPFRARSLSKPKYYSGLYSDRKGSLQLQLVGKASSIDHLDRNRVNSQENINTTMTMQNGPVKSGNTLKSPMGAKSKSYHNLVYNNGSNMTAVKAPSAPKYVSRYGQSTMRSGPVKAFESLKKPSLPNAQQLPGKQFVKQSTNSNTRQLKPYNFRAPATVYNNNNLSKEVSHTYGSSQGLAKPSTFNKPGIVRPSSGYQSFSNTNFSNNNYRNNKGGNDSDTESGRYSPNSLCSSSASSRGSLHPQENSTGTTHKMLNSVEDISTGSDTVTMIKQPAPSRLARPSGLKQPTVRSGLPRPTNFGKR